MPFPEFLYHYTSVNVLELILQNRTIRFNSLVNMDDMEEARTSDLGAGGKYIYISSWADDGNTENVALWGMYSNNYKGVRIRMKTDPFIHHRVGPLDYYDDPFADSVLTNEIISEKKLYLNPALPFIRRVEYTDDENLIINSVILKEQDLRNGLVMSFNDVGRYKRDAWAPQKEVRYQFFALPHNQEGIPIVNFNFTETGLPFSYWDASLSDEGFDSIEVTIGPKMEVEDRQRVSVLMNNCFPNGDDRIHQSVLKIK